MAKPKIKRRSLTKPPKTTGGDSGTDTEILEQILARLTAVETRLPGQNSKSRLKRLSETATSGATICGIILASILVTSLIGLVVFESTRSFAVIHEVHLPKKLIEQGLSAKKLTRNLVNEIKHIDLLLTKSNNIRKLINNQGLIEVFNKSEAAAILNDIYKHISFQRIKKITGKNSYINIEVPGTKSTVDDLANIVRSIFGMNNEIIDIYIFSTSSNQYKVNIYITSKGITHKVKSFSLKEDNWYQVGEFMARRILYFKRPLLRTLLYMEECIYKNSSITIPTNISLNEKICNTEIALSAIKKFLNKIEASNVIPKTNFKSTSLYTSIATLIATKKKGNIRNARSVGHTVHGLLLSQLASIEKIDDKRKNLLGLAQIAFVEAVKGRAGEAYQFYAEGVRFASKDEHKRAIPRFKEAIRRAEDENRIFIEAYLAMGVSHYDLDENKEAEKIFAKVISIERGNEVAFSNWCATLNKLERYGEAVGKCKSSLEINPKNATAYISWGYALANKKNPDYTGAIKKYKKAIEINSRNENAYYNWGFALARKKEPDHPGAIEKFKKAIEINPRSYGAYINWGHYLSSKKNPDNPGAIEKYKKAIVINPRGYAAYNNLGYSFIQASRYDEAIPILIKATQIKPKKPYSYKHIGVALIQTKQYNSAIGYLQNAINRKNDYAGAHKYMGDALLHLNKRRAAISSYKLALKHGPTKFQNLSEIIKKLNANLGTP